MQQHQQNTESFPQNGGSAYDEDDRKNRFLNLNNPNGDHHQQQHPNQSQHGGGEGGHHHHGSRAIRATSQPPHSADQQQTFPNSPIIPSSLGRSSGASAASPLTSGSPWSSSTHRLMAGRPGGVTIPVRSSSFSSSNAQSNFSSAMRESRAFDSTFEDDESEAFSDTYDDHQLISPSLGNNRNPRGRTYSQDPTRSRSQSLANTRAGSMQPNFLTSGGNVWADPPSVLSNPLNIPGARFGSSAVDMKPPGSSRYGSLGTIGRSPISMNSPIGNGYSSRQQQHTIDASNMSPFVRDVGSILLDEGSAFRELWAGMNPPKDENGGGGSGTTSRRHSVSVVQPRRGPNVVGFNAPESDMPDEPTRPAVFNQSSFGGRGGLMLSDDDLASDLGSLNLGNGPSVGFPTSHHHPPSQPSSLPIYAPLSHLTIPGGGNSLSRRSPSDMSGSGGSPPGRYDQLGGDQYGTPSQQQQQQQQQQPVRFIPGQGIFTQNGGVQVGNNTGGPDLMYRTRAPSYSGSATSPLSPTAGGQHHFFQTHQQPHQPQPQLPPIMARRLSEASSIGVSSPHSAHPPPSAGGASQPGFSDLGKGVPLHAVPHSWPLFIVEFKAGRTDLFYFPTDNPANPSSLTDPSSCTIRVGDLVIVEADRGKDLGKVVNDTITAAEVEAFQRQQVAKAAAAETPTSPGGTQSGGGGAAQGAAPGSKREINPKMIYGKAQPQDAQLLLTKMQDEQKALQLCQTKVRAKKLPMEVVDAEYQWDRRKLTFYFTAEKRIDFRELVRELFRLYKTRIWMASLQPGGGVSYEQ